MSAVGISLGTCYSCIAVHSSGRPQIVASADGDRLIPYFVAYQEEEKDFIAGLYAKRAGIRIPQAVISGQIIGNHSGAVISYCPFTSVKFENGVASLESIEKEVSIDQVLLDYATMLKETIQGAAGEQELRAVLATPSWFSESEKVKQVFEKVGISVMQTISESSAALLGSGLLDSPSDQPEVVAAIDFGGSCFSVSVYRLHNGLVNQLIESHDFSINGTAIDTVLYQHMEKEFKRVGRVKQDLNSRSRSKLELVIEQAKRKLSQVTTAKCAVESLHEGLDFNSALSRPVMEALISSILDSARNFINETLSKASLTSSQVEKVVLIGGSSRIPKFIEIVKSIFANAQLLNTAEPDELIALGCSIQAELLMRSANVPDTDSKTFILKSGIKLNGVTGGLELFKANSILPVSKSIVVKGSKEMYFELSQNKNVIGQIVLEGAEGGDVEVTFELDEDRLLSVSAAGKSTQLHFK